MASWLSPLVLVALLYCIPVWVLTETVAWVLDRKGIKDRVWAQVLLRILPAGIALVLCGLSPSTLGAALEEIRGKPVEHLGLGDLCLFALIIGTAAVQLHQWRVPQALGGAIRRGIAALGGQAADPAPDKDA